jgi:hypothetical protein
VRSPDGTPLYGIAVIEHALEEERSGRPA